MIYNAFLHIAEMLSEEKQPDAYLRTRRITSNEASNPKMIF